MKVQYLSGRGGRVIEREGQVIVDQHPGDERRLVVLRPIGKKLMINMKAARIKQRRNDESKWTRVGRLVGLKGKIEDQCPDCGDIYGTVKYRNAQVKRSFSGDLYRPRSGEWILECDCGWTGEPTIVPDEPAYPEPDTDDHATVLKHTQEYAEHVNETIFDGAINIHKVSWTWNGRNTSTAGRAYRYGKIELTPQYFDKHGWNEFIKVVRHELVHIWETQCAEDRSGHDVQFHDWIVPANTRRHCYGF